jgi:hypothetical protein
VPDDRSADIELAGFSGSVLTVFLDFLSCHIV